MKSAEVNKDPVVIERAVPDDAEAICKIRDIARIDAYPNEELGFTAEDVRIMSEGPDGEFLPRRIKFLISELEAEDGANNTIFVARSNDQVVGFVAPRYEDQKRWIDQAYILPEFQGKGIGVKLMKQALVSLGNDEDIYLHVVSYNQNAISFYEPFGFKKTDATIEDEEGRPSYLKKLPEIEMVRKANMKRFLVVHLLEPKKRGDEWLANNWPLHSTIAYPFNIDCDVSVIIKKIGSVLLDHSAFSVKALSDDYYGPQKDILVTPLEKSPAIMALSKDICRAIIDLGGIPENPAFYGDNGHRPHVTVQDHNRIHEGDVIDIKSITLLESIPQKPLNGRKVLNTFSLKN